MKKLLSVLIAALMLMQMFTFTVSASAPSKVWWTGEYAGEVAFSLVSGVKEYHLKLYKNNVFVADATHSFGDYDNSTGYHQFVYEILENGSGTYRVEVGPDDGSGNYTSSGNYVYKKPSTTLDKTNVKYDASIPMFTWSPVAGAVSYDAVIRVSWDGGETFESSWGYGCEGDCYFNFWDNWEEEMGYLMEEIEIEAEMNGYDVDDALLAFCVEAYPADFNDANPSYSDYVTFDGVSIPNDGNDNTGGTISGGCAAQELVWGEGGLVSFSLVGEDAKTCIIRLYKDDKMVDDTEYEIADYEMTFGVETFVFRETIARLGNGEYKFSVMMADENFEPYDDKEYFSNIYVYKVLEKVDRSSITDARYVESAKIAYDLGLIKNIYEKPSATITKGEFCEIAVKMLGAEETAKAMKDSNSFFSDIQKGTDLNGYVSYLYSAGIVNGDSSYVFGAETELTYVQIVKMLVAITGYEPYAQNYGGYPTGYLAAASSAKITSGVTLGADSTVTREQMGRLAANAIETKLVEIEKYTINGPVYKKTDKTLLLNYMGYVRILGTGYATENEISIENNILFSKDYPNGIASANVEIENTDYDAFALNGKRAMFYIKDSKNACTIKYFGGQVVINNGEEETSNRNVTLTINADGYTKYRFSNGTAYFPITSPISYRLPSASDGIQYVNIVLANDDETRTLSVSDSIILNNKRTIKYMVNGKVFATQTVGCGKSIPALAETPSLAGYRFDGWEPQMPPYMPDENLVVNARMTPITTVTGKVTKNGEPVSRAEIWAGYRYYGYTDVNGNINLDFDRGEYMLIVRSGKMSETIYCNMNQASLDLGTIELEPVSTDIMVHNQNVTSVAGTETIFTEEDKVFAETEGNVVSVKVEVDYADSNTNISAKENETDYKVESLIKIDIKKVKSGTENSQVFITETNNLLEFKFVIPENGKGKSSYVVLREHDGEVDMLTTKPNADGEYIVINQEQIVVYAKKFSTYGLATKEVVSAVETATGVSFEINLNEQVVEDGALMIVKAYNKNGVQLASKVISVTSEYNDTVTLECKGAVGYKLLFFDGLANIKPVYPPIDGKF